MAVSVVEVDVKQQQFDDFIAKFNSFQDALGKMAPAWTNAARAAAGTTSTIEDSADAAERIAAATEATANAQARLKPSNAGFAARTTPAAAVVGAASGVAAAAEAARRAPSPTASATTLVAGGQATATAASAARGDHGVNVVVNVVVQPDRAGGTPPPNTPAGAASPRLLANPRQARGEAQRAAELLRRTTSDIAHNVSDATGSLLKWVGISSIVSGLLGTAGGLFGIERLAGSASNMLRSSQGLGTTSAGQQAFGLNFAPTVGPGFLDQVADAESDLSRRWVFGHLGISQATQRGDSADLAAATLNSVKDLVDSQHGRITQQWADANGLTTVLGLSMADLRRIGAQTRAQLNAETQGYQADRTTFNLPPATLAVWQKLDVQLGRAGITIEDIFIRGLQPLAGPLANLSGAVTKTFSAFMTNPNLSGWINDLAGGITNLATWLNKADLQSELQTLETNTISFVDSLGTLAANTKIVASWMGVTVKAVQSLSDNPPGAPTPHGAIQETGQAIANVETAFGHWEVDTAKAGLRWVYGTADDLKARAMVAQLKAQARLIPAANMGAVEDTAAAAQGVPLSVSRAIFGVEGGLNPDGSAKISSTGAIGAGQLLWSTAKALGVQNPFDPTQNAQGAALYMAQLGRQFGGDPDKIAGAYYAGPGNMAADLRKWGNAWRAHLDDFQPGSSAYLRNFDARGGAGAVPGVPPPDTAVAFRALVSGITQGDRPAGRVDMTPFFAPHDHADTYAGPGGVRGAEERNKVALEENTRALRNHRPIVVHNATGGNATITAAQLRY